jgi:hypothetical protein
MIDKILARVNKALADATDAEPTKYRVLESSKLGIIEAVTFAELKAFFKEHILAIQAIVTADTESEMVYTYNPRRPTKGNSKTLCQRVYSRSKRE